MGPWAGIYPVECPKHPEVEENIFKPCPKCRKNRVPVMNVDSKRPFSQIWRSRQPHQAYLLLEATTPFEPIPGEEGNK
ncbi:MAG TPA: hypothetical protein PK295_03135 [Candidatus Magasanikbacteria bacterium]|nr:hypothetical protein [Candidatus Magasanikbacteria bacterium]